MFNVIIDSIPSIEAVTVYLYFAMVLHLFRQPIGDRLHRGVSTGGVSKFPDFLGRPVMYIDPLSGVPPIRYVNECIAVGAFLTDTAGSDRYIPSPITYKTPTTPSRSPISLVLTITDFQLTWLSIVDD